MQSDRPWIRRIVTLILSLAGGFGPLAPPARAAVDKVICVPWQGDPLKYHTAIDGLTIQLKGVVRTTDESSVWYKWVFGDGNESSVAMLSGATSYNIEVDHVYQGSAGTPFTARLLVDGVDSSLANAVADPYLVKIEVNGLDARVNIAIDNGLWYLHQNKSTYPRHLSMTGLPIAAWLQTSYGWYTAGPTASAIQAYQINGHKQTGNLDEDPYVLDVKYGFNFLFTGYVDDLSHPLLRSWTMSLQNGEDPDSNGNGIGIEARDYNYAPIYEGGMVMDAIIASGTPDEDCGRDFDENGVNDTYRQVLQDMCDQYAWGQCDVADGRGGLNGGWRYNWNDSPDNSASQWAAIGMIPAQQAPWNCVVPAWVKTNDDSWLVTSHYIWNGDLYGGFGYTGASYGNATTPSGMVQLDFIGATRDDPRWVRSERWLADNWSVWRDSVNFYAYYAFAKAMRLALPTPVTTFDSNSFDWYRGNPGTIGLAEKISDGLITNHYWNSPWADSRLATAWAVIILRPVLFQEAPIACFKAQPNPNYPDSPIEFDPGCSDHSDPAKNRDNLVLYEWDWDSNGTYDEASTGPEVRTHSFSCPSVPCVQPVTLRVTDDIGNHATYRQDIEITNPPHPPVARTLGPFWVSLCDNDTLQLNATNSFDVDEGQREAGCVSCPTDELTAWNWDLNGAPFDFDGPAGSIVELGPGFRTYFRAPGTYDIGVRVSDNTALAFPGSGKPNLTDDDFTQVVVFGEGVCHLMVSAHCQGADLSWDEVPSAEYTVWVSSQGPNTDFKSVATLTTNKLTLTGLPIGVPRWVRVSAQLATGALMSESAEVIADAGLCPPIADAGGPYVACAGRPLTLSAQNSTTPVGTIVSWEWDLDDDGEFDDASGAQIKHTFETPGTYIVHVRVTASSTVVLTDEASATVKVDLCGCIDSLVARAKLNKIQLVWQSEADAVSYNVHRSSSPWFTPSDQTLLKRGITSSFATYLDEGLPMGATFYYRVVKVGAGGGEICASNEAAATTTSRSGNAPPAANAGPDQVVAVGDTVDLDGSASFDGNGNPLSFQWRLLSAPAQSHAALSHEHDPKPTFVADLKGVYSFELIVNDGFVDSPPDTITVRTQNSPPQANAGMDQELPMGATVQLDGSNSTDPDGDPLTYRWILSSRPAQSDAAIDDPAAAKPTFRIDAAGVYRVQLIVNDGIADSAPVTVSVRTVNSPPTAQAGADQRVAVGHQAALDGGGSSDVDGDALTWNWTLNERPPGSSAALSDAHTPQTRLTPDVPGRYVVGLVVFDGQLNSTPDTVNVEANAGPVADAGEDQNGHVGVVVGLDGTGSSDPEGDTLSYQWSIESQPQGSRAELEDPTSARPTLTPDKRGEYGIKLRVSDGLSESDADEMVVTVLNTAPVANAGNDINVPVGQLVALSGTSSSDVDGDALNYAWVLTQRPAGSSASLSDAHGATPSFTADRPGEYVAQLIVSDGQAESAPDTVSVKTQDRPPVANAGPNQSRFVGESFTLDGRASADPDGDSLSFAWSINAAPPGSQAMLGMPDSPTPSLVADLAGEYRVQLVVSDGVLSSAPDEVSLTARAFILVPGVVGKSEAAAREAIVASGLGVGVVSTRSDANVPVGVILQQDPVADTKVEAGSAVNLVVSSGADTQTPVVTVIAEPGYVLVGGTVTIRVEVVDDGNLSSLELTVNDAPLALVGNQASFVCPALGAFVARATATDTAGHTGHGETTFYGADPSDTTPPTVELTAPADNAAISSLTDVVGSAFDPDGKFAFYTVEVAPAKQVDLSNLESTAFHEIGRGSTEVHNGKLATFDPTLLQNDAYVIRLTGWDQNGQGARKGVVVNVYGDLKLGNFRLEFTDLTVPLAGLPIQITRVYDTLQSAQKGDFGYGWRLGLRDAGIYEVLRPSYIGPTLAPGSRVFINTPDGRRVGFTANHEVIGVFGFVFVRVHFDGDPGVYEKLEMNGDNTAVLYQGVYTGGLATEPFDPSAYRLTLKDGTLYEYDQAEGLQKVTDLNDNRLVFTADGIFHYPAGASDSDQSIPFTRDAEGRITSIIDPAGNALNYTYDDAGDLRTYSDQAHNTTQYIYHPQRAHYLNTIIDPLGRQAVRTEYDDQGRIVAIIDALGHRVEQEFDTDQNIGTFTDANGHVTTEYFDDRGNVIKTIDAEGGTTEVQFDGNNNEVWRKDPLGNITQREYDDRGNVTRTVDALGNASTLTYSPQNKPITVTDALGRTTTFSYDAQGQLIKAINAVNQQATFVRDTQGRVINSTNFNGQVTTYSYEGGCSCGKPSKVTNPDGTVCTYEYNVFGQQTLETDELGHTRIWQYDDLGQLTSMTDAEGHTTSYEYTDALKVREIDPLGRITHFAYDSANRQIAVTNALGGIVRYEYDQGTNVTAIIDPVGNVTRFYYDGVNRLTRQVDPWARTNVFAYDAAGNRIEAIDRRGNRRTFAYDAVNRQTQERWWDGAVMTRTFDFAYNATGIMTNAADASGTIQYAFDALSRLTNSIQTGYGALAQFALSYAYDPQGNLLKVQDQWGVSITHQYDSRNRLIRRAWSGVSTAGASVALQYDASGNRTNIARFADAAGVQLVGQSQYEMSPARAVTDIAHRDPAGNSIASFTYQRDAAQRIVQRILNGQSVAYSYNFTGELTSAVYSNGQNNEGYAYDLNGNRTGSGFQVTTNNQVTADGRFTYAYDADGNLVARSNVVSGATWSFQYDYRNRLVTALTKDGAGQVMENVEFLYDALDRRIGKKVNGSTTYYLLNLNSEWADSNDSGDVMARYMFGKRIDERLARFRPGEGVFWYLTDNLGSVFHLVDNLGVVRNAITYDSFGRILSQSNAAAGDRFAFGGRAWDGDIELYYARSRYYDPVLGRFASLDPIGFDGGDDNLYRYANNDPINRFDPCGTQSFAETATLNTNISLRTAAAALAVGYAISCIFFHVADVLASFAGFDLPLDQTVYFAACKSVWKCSVKARGSCPVGCHIYRGTGRSKADAEAVAKSQCYAAGCEVHNETFNCQCGHVTCYKI